MIDATTITAWSQLVLAVATLYTTIRLGFKSDRNNASTIETKDAVRADVAELKEQTNGMTEKLVAAHETIAKAAGKLEERAEVADRRATNA